MYARNFELEGMSRCPGLSLSFPLLTGSPFITGSQHAAVNKTNKNSGLPGGDTPDISQLQLFYECPGSCQNHGRLDFI
jgi:hypothetical protein